MDYTEGFAPDVTAENNVLTVLAAEVDKPGGVTVVRDQVLPRKGSGHEWTIGELDQLAEATYTLSPRSDTVRIHVLFLDGQYGGGQVLGVAWANKHLVVFRETIERYCRAGLTPTLAAQVCRYTEQGVWTHELGHVLGLVNNGLAMTEPHEDSEHSRHDQSDQCIMYWAFETPDAISLLVQRLLGNEPPGLHFDTACKADLAAGRAAP